jgi:O-antigen ligase
VRAHSVELDALSELGMVGFALLLGVLVLPWPPILSRMRARDPAATAAFAGGAYWLVHASGDWIWTVPACGLPFWLLLGAGASGGDRRPLAMKAAVPAAAVAVVLAVVAFVPPWLSARLTDRGQYRWAKRFDPLSVDPYITQSSISALQAAVRKEPRVVEWRFDLAQAYQRARELKKARAELEHARRLDPADPRIQEALRNLPKRSIRSS